MNDATDDTRRPADADRYTRTAMWLHWSIAALIGFNLCVGFFMEDIAPPMKFVVITAHVSAGISVLMLSLVRVVWRLTHRPPPLLPGLRRWERALAHAVHAGLYVMMVALPLSGWALISANPPKGSTVAIEQARQFEEAKKAGLQPRRPVMSGIARFWWVVPLPSIGPVADMGREFDGVERQRELHDGMVEAHGVGAWLMLALLALHVAGALKHQWFDRQGQLARMGVARRSRRSQG